MTIVILIQQENNLDHFVALSSIRGRGNIALFAHTHTQTNTHMHTHFVYVLKSVFQRVLKISFLPSHTKQSE